MNLMGKQCLSRVGGDIAVRVWKWQVVIIYCHFALLSTSPKYHHYVIGRLFVDTPSHKLCYHWLKYKHNHGKQVILSIIVY